MKYFKLLYLVMLFLIASCNSRNEDPVVEPGQPSAEEEEETLCLTSSQAPVGSFALLNNEASYKYSLHEIPTLNSTEVNKFIDRVGEVSKVPLVMGEPQNGGKYKLKFINLDPDAFYLQLRVRWLPFQNVDQYFVSYDFDYIIEKLNGGTSFVTDEVFDFEGYPIILVEMMGDDYEKTFYQVDLRNQ